jgi:CheY-like chemotaxis protein
MQKILVDDDPMVRHVLSKVLKRGGYEVHLASDGSEGLRAFADLLPDLVIIDIIMPVKGGLDTIPLLRACSPGAKIVAISGGNRLGNKDFVDEATTLGAVAFVAKPFEPDELLAQVARALLTKA